MDAMHSEAQKLARARRRVEALSGFYIHAAVYVIVNAGLLLINVFTGPDWWVQWVVAGWGVGLIAHGAVVYGINHPRVAAWEERKVREIASQLDDDRARIAEPDVPARSPNPSP